MFSKVLWNFNLYRRMRVLEWKSFTLVREHSHGAKSKQVAI